MRNRNLTARNEKNPSCDFFAHPGNIFMILGRNVEQDQMTRMTTLPFLLLALSLFVSSPEPKAESELL